MRYDVRYLQSNGATANFVYDDLDIYFQGHTFFNVNISKTMRASKKCAITTFIEVDICHRMRLLQMLYFVTLTYNFQGHKYEMLISRKW